MNREIKFRAWDGKQMHSCIELSPFHVGDCDRFRWNWSDVQVMQFTGLLDKNGKEIYEGDILKFEDDIWLYNDKAVVEHYNGAFIVSISYDMIPVPLFDLKKVYQPSDYPNTEKYNWIKDPVVIGNIYQNPELLK